MREFKETLNDGDQIKCPSCDYVFQHLCDYELGEDDETEVECEGDGCGAKVTISCSVSVSYRASAKIDSKEHE